MDSGKVNIHGKEYLTVAYRVQEFRKEHSIKDGWSIVTEIITANEQLVIIKAIIRNHANVIIGTGHAEEYRSISRINKTSALENCETSAIGRALASAGFAGSEFASANEVENAIFQQTKIEKITKEQIYEILLAGELVGKKGEDVEKGARYYYNADLKNISTDQGKELLAKLKGENTKNGKL